MKIIKLLVFSFLTVFILSCGEDDPVATCTDGIQNGLESGIDCGGECIACPTCDDGLLNGDETDIDCGGSECSPCYGVGLIGEAEGVIFYDKGAITDGWRYLEAAPEDIIECGGSIQYFSSHGTDNNIGFGKMNTQILTANDISGSSVYSIVSSYSINGKSDWFIPSKDEITELYNNKDIIPYLSMVDGECAGYWNSTLEQLPNGNWLGKVIEMTSGEFFFPNPDQKIRPVRRF